MKNDIIKGLISVANSLDSKGFGKEADQLDRIMRKMAERYKGSESVSQAPGQDGNTVEEAIADAMEMEPGLDFEDIYISSYMGIAFANVSPGKAMLIWRGNANIDSGWLFRLFTKASGGDLWRFYVAAGGPDENVPEGASGSEETPSVARQAPTETPDCEPNGKPLIRIPGDKTYGYQLTEDGTGFMAWTLKDCKPVANGRVFTDPKGLEKVKSLAPSATPSATPDDASATSQGPEVTEETIEQIPVNPNADAIAGLQSLRGRVEAASETRRFEQDGPTVQEAQRLLGIKNITPLAPGVRRKYLLKLIDKGIAKLQGDSADDIFMSAEASKAEQRIAKFASLLSGEFGGLDKKIRR